jgi:hypothetical protein
MRVANPLSILLSLPSLMRFFLLPLLCLVVLLSSCIDGEEEIWIETDGSGGLEATYTMPKAFMEELITEVKSL